MITEIRISPHEVELMQKEFEANKPYMACGALIGTIKDRIAHVEKALPITNVKRTRVSFELDPKQFYDAWVDAEEKGKVIVGIYYTQMTTAVLSLQSRETMESRPQEVWLILGTDGMRAYIWENGVKTVKIIKDQSEKKFEITEKFGALSNQSFMTTEYNEVKIGIDPKHGIDVLKNYLFAETDVFLRELVSNSIDAVKERIKIGHPFDIGIRVYTDQKKKTLSVIDNGIGMTRDEAKKNMGNIFQTSKIGSGFIGMFGIGFYSSLKVAREVEVWTRSAVQSDDGCKLLFDGSDKIKVWETPRKEIGTDVKLSLKEEFSQDYTNLNKIKTILLKYFRFSPCPIYLGDFPEPICNETPVYLQQSQYITDQKWKEFLHQHLSLGDPITYYPLTGQVKGVLMIPRMLSKRQDSLDIHLYVNHVFIKDKAFELLSAPFRPFIGGIIDVKDLPISLNRKEELEDSSEIKDLRKTLNKSIMLWLSDCAEKQRQTFEEIMEYHGLSIKRVCIEFDDLLQHLYQYLTFQSSYEASTTLNEYLKRRRKDHQEEIFYLTDQNEQGPLLSLYNQKNIEVIFFETPEDQKLSQRLKKFYPGEHLVRINQYPIKKETGENTIFKPTDDKLMEEQLRQLFQMIVDKDLEVQLTLLPDRNLPSLILKKQKDYSDEFYKLLIEITLSKIDHPLPAQKEEIYDTVMSFTRDILATKVLLLNQSNPAVQRLGSLLNHKNFEDVENMIDLMTKTLYFMALISSKEELNQEQLEEYTRISSSILDSFGEYSFLNKLRDKNENKGSQLKNLIGKLKRR